MDAGLYNTLKQNGILDATLGVLLEEDVSTTHAFISLQKEHFDKLAQKLTVGQHAIMLKVWELQNCEQSEPGDKGSKTVPAVKRRRTCDPETSTSAFDRSSLAGPSWSELWKEYKSKQREQVEKLITPSKSARVKKTSMYHLGGMIYSVMKGKGVKKKGIPPPCEIELSLSASYDDVLQAGKENFFEDDEEVQLEHLTLADSTGTRIKIKNKDVWTIGDFYSRNDLKPSRYKLYVMYVPPDSGSNSDDGDSNQTKKGERNRESARCDLKPSFVAPPVPPLIPSKEESKTKSCLVTTKAQVASCERCGRNYYTYIPDTNCQMPDGSELFYKEAQLLCPLCDDAEFGWWFNQELFPEFEGRTLP